MMRRFSVAMMLAALAFLLPGIAMAQTNVALGRAITPITNTVLGAPATVTNGVPWDVWWSYQGGYYNTCSFTIDLGSSYTISQVVINLAQTFGYTLSSSNDGSTWTVRHTENFGASTMSTRTWNESGVYSARYFKYDAYANWIQYVGVGEFEVYGTTTAVPTLSEWGRIAMFMLLLGGGSWVLLRRRRAIA
jgi:hypothetical protein